MIVYVDVLVVTNLFINFLLLSVTRMLLRKNVSRKRLAAGAALGGFYALVIFLPQLPSAVTVLMHLAASAVIVLAAFPVSGGKDFCKSFAAFFAVSFAFAGLMFALWLGFAPNGMAYQNGAVYFDIDIRVLIVSTAVCYVLLTLTYRLLRRRAPDNSLYDIELTLNGKTVCAKALLDTGHTLSDGFSDRPVLVAAKRVVRRLADAPVYAFLDGEGVPAPENTLPVRLIPYKTIHDSGVLKAIPIDAVFVPSRRYRLQNVWLAESKTDFGASEYEVLLCGDFFERGGKQYAHSGKNKRNSF